MLGLDPGERRIGVALSDALGIIAQPHVVLDRREVDAVAQIKQLCAEYEVAAVVVGLPRSLSGEEGEAAVKARELGAAVGEATGCKIEFFDERFTTVQAESALIEGGMRRKKRRETIDKVAAAVMLQGYLDSGAADDA
ncbi:MAG: Holliday junction resolvase RuvX [bacterium]|nr:Holliday junction resolvase RuvX [bacterium]